MIKYRRVVGIIAKMLGDYPIKNPWILDMHTFYSKIITRFMKNFKCHICQVKEIINISIFNNFYEKNIHNLLHEVQMGNCEGCMPNF